MSLFLASFWCCFVSNIFKFLLKSLYFLEKSPLKTGIYCWFCTKSFIFTWFCVSYNFWFWFVKNEPGKFDLLFFMVISVFEYKGKIFLLPPESFFDSVMNGRFESWRYSIVGIILAVVKARLSDERLGMTQTLGNFGCFNYIVLLLKSDPYEFYILP